MRVLPALWGVFFLPLQEYRIPDSEELLLLGLAEVGQAVLEVLLADLHEEVQVLDVAVDRGGLVADRLHEGEVLLLVGLGLLVTAFLERAVLRGETIEPLLPPATAFGVLEGEAGHAREEQAEEDDDDEQDDSKHDSSSCGWDQRGGERGISTPSLANMGTTRARSMSPASRAHTTSLRGRRHLTGRS